MEYLYLLISALVSTVFLFVRYRYAYWKQRHVPHLAPVFPFGNLNRLTTFNMLERINEIYTKFKGTSPIAGLYLFIKPAVVILDLDLIKSILIKDFSIFTDRMQFFNEVHDPLSDNLFNMNGTKWRTMRTKLSPTFTSGKMKFMLPNVIEVAKELEETMRCDVEKSDAIEIRQLLARYTTDVIGMCVFGIQSNGLKDSHAEFCRYGRKIMERPHRSPMVRHFLLAFNELARELGLSANAETDTKYFMKLIKETIALREEKNIQRNDFMNLLIELKNKKSPNGLTIEEVAAQAFVFFAAGFETSASNMTFGLFELAKQPALQEKLREEILRVLQKYNNELTYEAMSEMTYLSQCIDETLRKYPALVSLSRKANQDYPISGTKFVIKKGTPVFIPVWSIHHDPEIYPHPNKFDPDRFNAANSQARDAMTFLGFGDGPRNCIGLRFGRMQVRAGLIMLLRSFKFSVSEKTPQQIEINPKSFVVTPKDELWLKVEAV